MTTVWFHLHHSTITRPPHPNQHQIFLDTRLVITIDPPSTASYSAEDPGLAVITTSSETQVLVATGESGNFQVVKLTVQANPYLTTPPVAYQSTAFDCSVLSFGE